MQHCCILKLSGSSVLDHQEAKSVLGACYVISEMEDRLFNAPSLTSTLIETTSFHQTITEP